MQQSSLLVIFVIVFIDLVGFGIVLPALPFLSAEYGGSAFHLGLLMSCYSLIQFLVSPVWGRISDYFGRRAVLYLCLLGTCVSMLLLGVSGSLQWIFISRAVAGLFGATLSTAYSYVMDVAPEKDRGRAFGMLAAGSGLGMIFGPAIGGLLSRYGNNLPMFATAILALFNLLFALLRLEEAPRLAAEARAQNRYRRFDLDTLRLALEDPRARLASVLLFLATLAMTQMESSFAFYLFQRYAYDAEIAGAVLSTMGLIMVSVQAGWVGRLLRKYGELRMVILASTLFCAGLLGFTLGGGLPLVIASLGVLAVGQGMINPVLGSLANTGAAAHRKAVTLGVYRSFGSLARIIGPAGAGWLFDRVSWRSPFLAGALALGCAAFISFLWTVLPSRLAQLAEARSNPYHEG